MRVTIQNADSNPSVKGRLCLISRAGPKEYDHSRPNASVEETMHREDLFIPELIVHDGPAALDFYKSVFGAEEVDRMLKPGPDAHTLPSSLAYLPAPPRRART